MDEKRLAEIERQARAAVERYENSAGWSGGSAGAAPPDAERWALELVAEVRRLRALLDEEYMSRAGGP